MSEIITVALPLASIPEQRTDADCDEQRERQEYGLPHGSQQASGQKNQPEYPHRPHEAGHHPGSTEVHGDDASTIVVRN
ncbi:MAG: hypothetical protein M3Z65_00830 [Chloroflexota bacterium]|nr:hypothetical protein [Chloroflexota bacterium]